MDFYYKDTSIVVAESVYQFIKGGIYGALWGCVTPFHPPNSIQSSWNNKHIEKGSSTFTSIPSHNITSRNVNTGGGDGYLKKPLIPFSSWKAIHTNSIMFGCIMGVQRFTSQMLATSRHRQDFWNDLFGFLISYQYYKYIFDCIEPYPHRRFMIHNRIVMASVTSCIVYAQFC